jgi:basic membrane lipoprotein Med (substrate-binding protein (PBP1-ABC) superfamily)
MSDEPRIKAYYEFMEFYKDSRLYCIQYRRPGDYAKLLALLGKEPGESWDDAERRTFNAYFQYFLDAYSTLNETLDDILPEEALLLWLQVNPYKDLGGMSAAELCKSLTALWPDVVAGTRQSDVQTEAATVTDAKGGILSRIIAPGHVNVAFIHQLDESNNPWVQGHEAGRRYLEQQLGDKVTCRSYFHANTKEDARELLDKAVADGAQVVFTTHVQLNRQTLKAAVRHPKVKFLNCSVNVRYSSVRSYYSRMYEGKFVAGAIAGAMANNDKIGYIGSCPTYGETASINAFALGAQMTNPRARIDLRWSCLPGEPSKDFAELGYQVVSNRNVPAADRTYLAASEYGTWAYLEDGTQVAIGSPVWLWGHMYERIVNSILQGTYDSEKGQAVNYWWGMESQASDILLSDELPESMQFLANLLRTGFIKGKLDPFYRKIVAQDGTVVNDGTRHFTVEELLRMDWLCENIDGYIPEYEEVLPYAQPMMKALGLHKERIPVEKDDIV